jgi:hypothetical protein
MTEQTREAVDSYIGGASAKPGEFLFGGRRGRDRRGGEAAVAHYLREILQIVPVLQ